MLSGIPLGILAGLVMWELDKVERSSASFETKSELRSGGIKADNSEALNPLRDERPGEDIWCPFTSEPGYDDGPLPFNSEGFPKLARVKAAFWWFLRRSRPEGGSGHARTALEGPDDVVGVCCVGGGCCAIGGMATVAEEEWFVCASSEDWKSIFSSKQAAKVILWLLSDNHD